MVNKVNKSKCKICRTCKIEKDVSCFYTQRAGKYGVVANCADCSKKSSKLKYINNRAYCIDKSKAKYRESPETKRNYDLKRKYNITLEEYDLLLKKQNSCCAICGISNKEHLQKVSRNLAVDHCHGSNKIRGLLCDLCNRAMGMFKDCPETLSKALEYLRGVHD